MSFEFVPIISVFVLQCLEFYLCFFSSTSSITYGFSCFIDEYHKLHDSLIKGTVSDVSSWNSISIELSASFSTDPNPYSYLTGDPFQMKDD